MKNTPDGLGGANPAGQRFAGQVTYRSAHSRDSVFDLPEQSTDSPPFAGGTDPSTTSGPAMHETPPAGPPTSINDLEPLPDSAFPPNGWLDDTPSGTLADHPLLRGLLLELPPKGSTPAPGWLDRWFDAARSILDLLYLQDTHGPRHG